MKKFLFAPHFSFLETVVISTATHSFINGYIIGGILIILFGVTAFVICKSILGVEYSVSEKRK